MKLNSLHEAMGSREYVPPTDARQLMADFYTVQLLKSRPKAASHRDDSVSYEVDYVYGLLIPRLREHLLDKAGYSIVCEFRHVFDATEELGGVSTVAVVKELGVPTQTLEMLARASAQNSRPQPEDVDMGVKLACARAGVKLFNGLSRDDDAALNWCYAFGGRPWAVACGVWLHLYDARSLRDAEMYIDRLYSVEHNNGNLLDKNREYAGSWVREMLNAKFKANDLEALTAYSSSYVRQLAHAALYSSFRKGAQIRTDDSPSAVVMAEFSRHGLKLRPREQVDRYDVLDDFGTLVGSVAILHDLLSVYRVGSSLGKMFAPNSDGVAKATKFLVGGTT